MNIEREFERDEKNVYTIYRERNTVDVCAQIAKENEKEKKEAIIAQRCRYSPIDTYCDKILLIHIFIEVVDDPLEIGEYTNQFNSCRLKTITFAMCTALRCSTLL